jgi:hypothetical protein
MTGERAKYILENRLIGGGLRRAFSLPGGGDKLYDDGMTRAEYEAVRAVWITLPGGASFYSALCEVANGRAVCPSRMACGNCGCTGQPHYFVNTGAETLCVDCA